ncbi:MAG: phosphatidylserine decarboxylase family protein [Bacteroidetes bacterium]|nr:phosphatidylserine decarboxylase family protein [Bacteroidota bacterium]
MTIHKEGRRILLIVFALMFALNLIIIKNSNFAFASLFYTASITGCSLFYLWMAYFFRDPKRTITKSNKHILSPADGRIIYIEETVEDEYFKDKRLKISIFMSPFNVHVNRNPISGNIKFFKYHAGKYFVANHPKSSKKNERTTIVIRNEKGYEVLFRQVAGFIARRIKFYGKQGDDVQQGDEAGFIKFGSRADIYLPLKTKLSVKEGDKVKGGITVLAEV